VAADVLSNSAKPEGSRQQWPVLQRREGVLANQFDAS